MSAQGRLQAAARGREVQASNEEAQAKTGDTTKQTLPRKDNYYSLN